MNTRLLFTGLISLLSLQAGAQLSSGLVAHWPFNGNAGDSSGNNNHGIPVFLNYGIGQNGLANTAAIFDGSKTYISVPYQSNMNVSSYSICAIVKPTAYYSGLCQTNSILWRGYQTTSSNYALFFFDNAYDNNCNAQDTSKNVFASFAGASTGNRVQWQYSPNIVSNSWYTVVATYTADTMRIYVNGTLKSKYTVTSGPMGTSSEGILIGANYGNTTGNYPYWLKGAVDDLRLYNRALTDAEIKQYSYGVYIDPPLPTVLCKNVNYTLPFKTINDFMPGNTFTLQLSNASGDFGTPTILNAVTGTQSGIFNYTIPSIVTTGTGYKMRIVTSQPFSVSDTISGLNIGVATTPPTVYATVAPGNNIPFGTYTFFTAIANNAGTPSYQWRKNSQAIAGATNNTWGGTAGIHYSDGDIISVTVRSSTFCATPDSVNSTPIIMHIQGNSVGNITTNHAAIYPNPANSSITIKATNMANGAVTISLHNTLGQLVLEESATITDNKFEKNVNTYSFPSGNYYLYIKNKENVIHLPLIINH